MSIASSDFADPMFRIMAFLRDRLRELSQGMELEDGYIWRGPKAEHVIVYGTKSRLDMSNRTGIWTRAIFLSPSSDVSAGRVVGRDDRNLQFFISAFTQLTEVEARKDVPDHASADRLVARADDLVSDLKALIRSNINMTSTACPTGITDDVSVSVEWLDDCEWPCAGFSMTVDVQASEYAQ